MENVSLDVITDVLANSGYEAVVVFVCMFTKRCVVEPTTKTVVAEPLAEIMHRSVFRHFGVPSMLVFDRDPRFMSDF
jgi:hypothetical protein